MNGKSIFAKSTITLKMDDVINSIPQDSFDKPNIQLQQTNTEWRWRLFDINDRKVIEITYKHPNKPRMYKDNQGNWIEYTLDKEWIWDKYLTYSKYYYSTSS